MSDVVLFGCGRGAEVAYRHLSKDSPHRVCGFAVDAQHKRQDSLRGLPVVAFEEVEKHFPPDRYRMFILLGFQEMNRLRAEKYAAAKRRGYQFINYVASGLFAVEDLQIGDNCFILDKQSINLDVRIGSNVVMWSGNHIGDLSVVEDNVWISSHATLSGNVTVGAGSFIGIGATISNHVRIGEGCYIGANALITKDTPPRGVYLAGDTRRSMDDAATFLKVLDATNRT
jgi:sugar O-acyltransferase (sialic acid O-acetyltransferase NeuD family)